MVVSDVHRVSDQQDGKLLSWVCDHLPQSTSSKIVCHSEYAGQYPSLWTAWDQPHPWLPIHTNNRPVAQHHPSLQSRVSTNWSMSSFQVGESYLCSFWNTPYSKRRGLGRVLSWRLISYHQHSILNCHTRGIRETTSMAHNDIQDSLDMLTSISMVIFW